MQRKLIISGLLFGILTPLSAAAYFTPQEVLMSQDFYLPPTSREADDRVANQTERSNQRREYEHSQLENLQEKETAEEDADAEENTDENLKESAPELEDLLTEDEKRLLKTVRLLDSREERLLNRVQQNQAVQYYGQQRLHGGAPPLAPTGAGGVLAAVTMLGAILWTIYLVKKAERTNSAVISR